MAQSPHVLGNSSLVAANQLMDSFTISSIYNI